MPKAKRGPVVKTDWVVEADNDWSKPEAFKSLEEAIKYRDFLINVYKRNSPKAYERKWRAL